jgi:fructose-specific component phosphotransferase system IIB-like protein
MKRPTFEQLHEEARATVENAEPPDTQQGADAQLVAVVLYDWIAANSDTTGRQAVADAIAEAFDWPEHGWPENDDAGPKEPALS